MTKLKEECGVFGIFDAEKLQYATLGLHSLQHRGQEGAGIVSYDGKKFSAIKKQGLVGDNFNVMKSFQIYQKNCDRSC